MTRIRAALVLLVLFMGIAPTVATASTPPIPQHAVSCVGSVNPPTRTTTAVSVSGAVECNSSVDVANTYFTVQIYDNGWRDYGKAFVTSSTSATLIMSDGAPLKSGTWSYRGRIHREAFHGSWGTSDTYGASRTYSH